MIHLGDVNVGSTVRLPFNTSAVAGESITIGTNGTIAIYKDGSTTERSSASGVTFTEDHDTHTGTHVITIDLGDNADAGFFAAGSFYMVKYHTAAIDGKAVNAWVGAFSIDKTNQKADVSKWLGTAAATPTVAGVPEVDVTHVAGTVQTAGDLAAKLGTPSNLGSGATLASNLVDIEGQTDDIGVAGAGLTSLASQSSLDTLGTRIPAALTAGGNMKSQLADGVIHGGTTATLRLGTSSLSIPAFYVTNAAGDAVQFESIGGYGLDMNGTVGDFRGDLSGDIFGEINGNIVGTLNGFATTAKAQIELEVSEALAAFGASTLTAAGIRAAVGLVLANLDTQLADVSTWATRGLTMIELDGGVYRYTINALEQSPAGGGGGGADPLLNLVPGAYLSGTAGAALGSIGSGQITKVSPVAQSGDIELVRGDDYFAADNRALEWTDVSAAWPNLTGTIELSINNGQVTQAGSIITATGPNKKVRVELTAAKTALLSLGTRGFQVKATLTGGHIITLVHGIARVKDSEKT